MKKNKKILVYRILLFIIIIVGIFLNFIAKNKDFNLLFSYYTIQSNMIVMFFLVIEIIHYFRPFKLFEKEGTYQNIKGMITLTILITGFVFAIILAPYVRDWSGARLYSSYLLHYISPLMVLLDFLFFNKPSKKISFKMCLAWFIYPIIYYIFGVIRVLFLDGFVPYPFLNVKELGPIKSIEYFLILFISFYFVSTILIFIKNKQVKDK